MEVFFGGPGRCKLEAESKRHLGPPGRGQRAGDPGRAKIGGPGRAQSEAEGRRPRKGQIGGPGRTKMGGREQKAS